MSKFLAQYLAELVKIDEDQSLNIEERELKVAKALQSFPGGNSADFACTPGTSQRILMAHQSLLPDNLHKRFTQETIDKNIQKFLPSIPLDCEIHLPNFLLSLVALEKTSVVLNKDPNIRFAGPNTKANDLYDYLLEFKTDNFSRKFDEKIDLICTKFENESKKLGLNTANLESISSGENVALFNFLKATAENIFVDQPIYAFKADFDYEFFFSSASKQEDRILLNKEQLKEKILQSYRDAHPTLFDQSKYDSFKYLPQKNELFSTSQEELEFLDLKKIDNLVNLFEKINETDSEEEKREKINKFNSGILILNSLSSNCSRINDSYFIEFFQKFFEKKGKNLLIF